MEMAHFLQLFVDLHYNINWLPKLHLYLYLWKAVRYTAPYSRGQVLDMKARRALCNSVLPLTLKKTS